MSDSDPLPPSSFPFHHYSSDNESDDGSESEDPPGFVEAILNDVLSSDNPVYDEEDIIDEVEPLSDATEIGEGTNPTLNALQYLANAGISLDQLLESVLFADESIRGERLVVNSRNKLFQSSALPRVLDHIRSPPNMRIRGNAHKEAKHEVENWALKTSAELLRKELVQYAVTTKAQDTEINIVSEESLETMTFDALFEQIEAHAPRLYSHLADICMGKRQDRNKLKDPKFVCLFHSNTGTPEAYMRHTPVYHYVHQCTRQPGLPL